MDSDQLESPAELHDTLVRLEIAAAFLASEIASEAAEAALPR